MEPTIPTATNLKVENAEGTQYSAEINGKVWSGITSVSNLMPSVQKALDEGAVPATYVAPILPSAELLELGTLDASMPRGTEDLIDTLVAKGVITLEDLPTPAKDKVNRKKALRSAL